MQTKTKTLTFTNGQVRRTLDVYDKGIAIRKLIYSQLKFYEKANIIGFKNLILRPIKNNDSLATIALSVEVCFIK